ncbi:hypothetical protein K440DRAFT_636140 [Wilcoxina mikolae CBS 423.85]|nr:hypothetical protein K440DRAFT_636140 [Wilcoxina mikolae CBS 423.85]
MPSPRITRLALRSGFIGVLPLQSNPLQIVPTMAGHANVSSGRHLRTTNAVDLTTLTRDVQAMKQQNKAMLDMIPSNVMTRDDLKHKESTKEALNEDKTANNDRNGDSQTINLVRVLRELQELREMVEENNQANVIIENKVNSKLKTAEIHQTELREEFKAALSVVTAMFDDVHIPLMVHICSSSLYKSEVLPKIPRAIHPSSKHKPINYASNISKFADPEVMGFSISERDLWAERFDAIRNRRNFIAHQSPPQSIITALKYCKTDAGSKLDKRIMSSAFRKQWGCFPAAWEGMTDEQKQLAMAKPMENASDEEMQELHSGVQSCEELGDSGMVKEENAGRDEEGNN